MFVQTVPDVPVWFVQARAEVQLLTSRAIRPVDVQGLLLWVLADGMNPNWCFVKVCDNFTDPVCCCKLIIHPGQELNTCCAPTSFNNLCFCSSVFRWITRVARTLMSGCADDILKVYTIACIMVSVTTPYTAL